MSISHAVRTLARNRGPAFVITLTLAVAIAAATIIASTLDRLSHALPIREWDRLVYVASTDPRPSQAQSGMSGGLALTGTSVPDLVDWSARTTTIDAFGAYRYDTATMTGIDPTPSRASIVRVTVNLLEQWGIVPVLGRGFRSADGDAGAAPVALLGHRFWQQRFASNAQAVGQTVFLDGVSYAIVGVVPASAEGGIFGYKEFWVPQPLDAERAARDVRRLFVTARMKPGVSMVQAQADLAGIAEHLKVEHPATNAQTGIIVRPTIEMLGGELPVMETLLGLIAALVIAMACANVSNVILAQVSSRQRELSLRRALGASRLDQIAQVLGEAFIVSALASLAGVVLGAWGLAALKWLAGPEALVFAEATVNWRVLLAAAATAFVVPFGFALLPAIQSSRADASLVMSGARTTGQGQRIRRALVAGQVAVAVVLLVQVALLARTAWNLKQAALGFDPRQLLTLHVDLSSARYGDPERRVQFSRDLLARIESLPGVTSAAAVSRLPIADRDVTVKMKVEGEPPVAAEALPSASLAIVSREYLDVLRVAQLRGRRFADADFGGGQPVALVSERAAQLLWHDRNPIGRRVTLVSPGEPDLPVVVVGIVANIRNTYVEPQPVPQVYIPLTARPSRAMAIVVRTDRGDPSQVLPAIRAQAAALDPSEPIFDALSMEQVLFNDLASTYALAGMLTAIAVITLCLAAVGIYGVVSFMVVQRTREIGVRVAVGASPSAVERLILGQSARPVLGGAVLGAPAALALVYAMTGVFTSVDVRDPTNYLGVACAIALVTLVASSVPARRAARLDPLTALRAE